MRKHFFPFLLVLLALSGGALVRPLLARAQGIDIGSLTGLGGTNLVTIVLNLLHTALGLIGILAVLMILLGGFRWMLSAGDEEKIAQAKRTIGATIIGLVVILLAWAIVSFVINTTANVSGVSP
ncbi:MAG: pilin [bacterium]